MRLKDTPKGSRIFIDASILLTVALKRPKRYVAACREFLTKVARKEVEAFISNLVLDEILYKLIQTEAAKRHGLSVMSPITSNRIRHAFPSSKSAGKPSTLLCDWVPWCCHCPLISEMLWKTCKKYHLLTRDALHILTMQAHGLNELASTDSDFQRVPWIKLYQP